MNFNNTARLAVLFFIVWHFKLMDDDVLVDVFEKDNSLKALALLYDTYAAALYRSILKLVPEKSLAGKILRNSFLQMLQELRQLDAKSSSIFCWTLRIALCQCKQLAGVKDCDIRQAFVFRQQGTAYSPTKQSQTLCFHPDSKRFY